LEICLNRLKLIPITTLFVVSLLGATDFKIATYNVENLFDLKFNGSEYREYIPNYYNWNIKTLRLKLKNISEVICEIDADIIGLQEIENLNALKLLQKTLKYYGCPYRYYAITNKSTTATEVAILSRFKIENFKILKVPKKSLRDILEVKIVIDKTPLFIFINHWSSKRNRVVSSISAKILKRRLKELKNKEYILLGDFNSNYNEDRLAKILNANRRVCQISPNSFSHYNLWYELPIYQRWSYNFYGKKEGLDNILIAPTLMDGKRVEYIKGSFNRFKPKYLFHKRGYILRWAYKNGKHLGVGYSDHLPLYAKFSTTKPFKFPNCNITDSNITALKKTNIRLPVRLKKIEVIELKEKNIAYIKDKSGEIKIFGVDVNNNLKKGGLYDIVVYKITKYRGEIEIVDFEIEKRYHNTKKEY